MKKRIIQTSFSLILILVLMPIPTYVGYSNADTPSVVHFFDDFSSYTVGQLPVLAT